MVADIDPPVRVVRLLHPSGNGGTTTCAWARLLAHDPASGVRLSSFQGRTDISGAPGYSKNNCNLPCSVPSVNHGLHVTGRIVRTPPLCGGTSCAALHSYLREQGNVTWIQVENTVTVREWPCPGVLDALLLRDPWDRANTLLSDVDSSATSHFRSRDRLCAAVSRTPEMLARFDNSVVRMLVGLPLDQRCPVGACVNETHLGEALRILPRIAVLPTFDLSAAMSSLAQHMGNTSYQMRVQPPPAGLRRHLSHDGRLGAAGLNRWTSWPACIALRGRLAVLNWADSALYASALQQYIQRGASASRK